MYVYVCVCTYVFFQNLFLKNINDVRMPGFLSYAYKNII